MVILQAVLPFSDAEASGEDHRPHVASPQSALRAPAQSLEQTLRRCDRANPVRLQGQHPQRQRRRRLRMTFGRAHRRETNTKARAAMSCRYLDVEHASMTRDDFLHDREPQSGTFAGSSGYSIEALQHFAPLGLGNAGTRVLDAEECDPFGTSCPDCHGAARRRVPQRVVEQIVDELGQEQRIAAHFRALERESEVDVAARSRAPIRARPRRRSRADRRARTFGRLPARFRPSLARAAGSRDGLRARWRRACARLRRHVRRQLAAQQQLEMHLQPGERRPQLMRCIREESLLHRACVTHLAQEPVERVDDRRDLDRRGGRRQRTQVSRRAPHNSSAAARAAAVHGRRPATRERSPRSRRVVWGRIQRRGFRRSAGCACAAFPRPAPCSRSPSDARRCGFLALADAVEECLLPRAELGRRRQVRDAIDDRVGRRAHLEDHPVDLIVDERLERLLRQVDVRAPASIRTFSAMSSAGSSSERS